MWTEEDRARYDRTLLRCPSDLTDEEWASIRSEIPRVKRGGNKRTVDVREVINGLMYVLSTGCQWRAIPKDQPPRSTVNHYFCRWQHDGKTACPSADWVARPIQRSRGLLAWGEPVLSAGDEPWNKVAKSSLRWTLRKPGMRWRLPRMGDLARSGMSARSTAIQSRCAGWWRGSKSGMASYISATRLDRPGMVCIADSSRWATNASWSRRRSFPSALATGLRRTGETRSSSPSYRAPASLRPFGCRTRRTKRSRSWSARERAP